ncbi:hypothetical protein Hanom_Chr07g00681671 [Helianthus anomalus]
MSLNMEQQIEDATMDKDVKVSFIHTCLLRMVVNSTFFFFQVALMDNSFLRPIVCKPTYESDKEIDDVDFEALNGAHKDIPSRLVDSQQAIISEPFYELAKVCKFKRINKGQML